MRAERRLPLGKCAEETGEGVAGMERRAAWAGFEEVPVGVTGNGPEPLKRSLEGGDGWRAESRHRRRAVEDHRHGLPRIGADEARLDEEPGEGEAGEELHPKRHRLPEAFETDSTGGERPGMLEEKQRARDDAPRALPQAVDGDKERHGSQRQKSPRIGKHDPHVLLLSVPFSRSREHRRGSPRRGLPRGMSPRHRFGPSRSRAAHTTRARP